jgi:hypothetical protein
MNDVEKHADRLYEKFITEDFIADDFEFFKEVKNLLPYTNVYFLACLTEVISDFVNEQKYLNKHFKDFSFEGLLRYCVRKAEKLYQSTNISEYLLRNF